MKIASYSRWIKFDISGHLRVSSHWPIAFSSSLLHGIVLLHHAGFKPSFNSRVTVQHASLFLAESNLSHGNLHRKHFFDQLERLRCPAATRLRRDCHIEQQDEVNGPAPRIALVSGNS